MAILDDVQNSLTALPGVTCGKSRLGSGLAWFIAGREFAHLHHGNVVDLRLPRQLQKTLRGDGRVRSRKSASDWVEVEFHRPEDARWVAELAHQATKALTATDGGA